MQRYYHVRVSGTNLFWIMERGERMNKTLDYYERNAAEVSSRFEAIGMLEVVDRFVDALPDAARTGQAPVLELGCGSGRDAAHLLRRGLDVCAADGSEAMLAEAVRHHGELAGRTRYVRLGDGAPKLPFEDGWFGGVYSMAMLMHLELSELPEAFSELARILAPGGLLCYSVNTERAGLDERASDERGRHFSCLPLEEWEAMHLDVGLETELKEESDDGAGRPGVRWATFHARKAFNPGDSRPIL